MQQILVTGASGMLGYKVAEQLAAHNNFNVVGTGRKHIHSSFNYIQTNLLNDEELNNLLHSVKPNIIIHCAANVNLNDCELNKDAAYKLHVDVSQKLASYNSNCKVVYVSTDSVFNGIKANVSESDVPEPYNCYAASKLKGETAVMEANSSSVIIRTNIYGFNQFETGNSLFEWLYKNLSAHQAITGFDNVYFNPLYIGQLADVIIKILENDAHGIYHAGCNEYISKYQFALIIAEAFLFKKSLIKRGDFNDENSTVKRPKNTTLNTIKLSKRINQKYSIKDGIEGLKKDFIQQKKLHAEYLN